MLALLFYIEDLLLAMQHTVHVTTLNCNWCIIQGYNTRACYSLEDGIWVVVLTSLRAVLSGHVHFFQFLGGFSGRA